jgi:hypothetical protein
MHRRCALVATALLVATSGCVTVSREAGEPASCQALLDDPSWLRAQADAALAEKNLEVAYRYLAWIEALHPESPESTEAFPLTARLFKTLYHRNRYTRPDSIWLTSEPVFLFQWLARYFGNDDFPREQAQALFVGLPYGFFREFVAFSESQPNLRGWTLSAEEDNGIVTAISARRAEAVVPGA